MTWYKFQCLQCGKKFKTDAALAAHQRSFHQKHEQQRKRAEHLARRAGASTRVTRGPRQGVNWLALIVFLIIVAAFVYFFYIK